MMLLVKGDRGLYCSDGKRIYFPDRSWKDAEECIIDDYEVKRDKDTYAFITANPINNEPISIEDIPNFDADFDTSNFTAVSYLSVNFGKSNIILKSSAYCNCVYYKYNGKVLELYFSSSSKEFYALRARGTVINIDKLSFFENKYKMTSEEKILEALFRIMKAEFRVKDGLVVINDTFIIVKTGLFDGSSFDSEYIYYYDSENNKVKKLYYFSDSGDLKDYTKKVRKFNVNDLTKLMLDYRVSCKSLSTIAPFSNDLVKIIINKDNFNAIIYAYDADNFTFEKYNSSENSIDRQLIEQSFDIYNSRIKAIGKSLSAKTVVDFMKAVNIRSYLTNRLG